MDRNTFAETFTKHAFATPFQPFTVVMVNGDRVAIDRANAVAYRDGTGLFVAPNRTPHIFDCGCVAQIISDTQ